MKKVRTATLVGTKYDILIGEFDGVADTDNRYSILIGRNLNTCAGLETLIHEALHGCNWHAKEELVENTAKDVARLLWRLGYRKIE